MEDGCLKDKQDEGREVGKGCDVGARHFYNTGEKTYFSDVCCNYFEDRKFKLLKFDIINDAKAP